MKFKTLAASIAFVTLLIFSPDAVSAARREVSSVSTWTKIRTANFLFVGDAPAAEIRAIALYLEDLRRAFRVVLPAPHFASQSPTVVYIFRDERSYSPFKPLHRDRPAHNIAGYFQPGADGNVITLHAGRPAARDTLHVAVHEYVHLLVNNAYPHAPLWLREGLADYYSTADIALPDRITLGAPPAGRAEVLNDARLIPLRALFAVDPYSPYYIEPDKRAIFYAQSWALIHLLLDNARHAQLAHYLQLLDTEANSDLAFRTAFRTDFAVLEGELRFYTRRLRFREQSIPLHDSQNTLRADTLNLTAPQRAASDSVIESRSLSFAEAQVYLGELFTRAERFGDAEQRLRSAVALDPRLPAAHIAFGVSCLRQQQFIEARDHFARALQFAPDNHLALYYHANASANVATDDDATVKGYAAKTELLRSELRRAINTSPDFIEAHRLLAEIEIERGADAALASDIIMRAIRLAPHRADLKILLARQHLRTGDYASARRALAEARQNRLPTHLRDASERLAEAITEREDHDARHRQQADNTLSKFAWKPTTLPCDLPQPGPYIKPLRFDGEQACGRLIEIACDDSQVVLHVETDAGALRLRAPALNRIRFVAYTIESRHTTTCGTQPTPARVLVTYRPAPKDDHTSVDGEAVAVEFVPAEWNR